MNKEGVIKFNLKFSKSEALSLEEIWELNNWRKILFLNGILRQDPSRYEGYGFGNTSRRIQPWDSPPTKRPFIISGTQTQNLADLGPEHYTTVLECDSLKNTVLAEGPLPPSSEALTHGAVYDLDSEIRFAFHVHSPTIWKEAGELKIPLTHPKALYGTPEMAMEIKHLFEKGLIHEKRIFAMGGHEDGVVSFGKTADEAGFLLLNHLVKALAQ